jgi:hypothetical protein
LIDTTAVMGTELSAQLDSSFLPPHQYLQPHTRPTELPPHRYQQVYAWKHQNPLETDPHYPSFAQQQAQSAPTVDNAADNPHSIASQYNSSILRESPTAVSLSRLENLPTGWKHHSEDAEELRTNAMPFHCCSTHQDVISNAQDEFDDILPLLQAFLDDCHDDCLIDTTAVMGTELSAQLDSSFLPPHQYLQPHTRRHQIQETDQNPPVHGPNTQQQAQSVPPIHNAADCKRSFPEHHLCSSISCDSAKSPTLEFLSRWACRNSAVEALAISSSSLCIAPKHSTSTSTIASSGTSGTWWSHRCASRSTDRLDKDSRVHKNEEIMHHNGSDDVSKGGISVNQVQMPVSVPSRSKKNCTHKKQTSNGPTVRDVTFGRGGGSNHHPGNKSYLDHIRSLQEEYRKMSRENKTKCSQGVVDWVHQRGGRFLQRDDEGNNSSCWYEPSNAVARTKVSQALRQDHTPEGRAKKRQRHKADY